MGDILLKLQKLRDNQDIVKQHPARFKVLLAGRRFGKSVLAKDVTLTYMLKGKKTAYITPTYGLAKVFYASLIDTLPDEIIKEQNKSDLFIQLITGGSVRFFSGVRLDNIRGLAFHHITIDEAAFIPDLKQAWNTSLRPTLSDFQGSALLISTPNGKNFFHSLAMKGKNGEDGFKTFHYTTYANPFISLIEIQQAKDTLPSAYFRQEYLAEAAEKANNPFGISNIKSCTQADYSTNNPVVYGIDLAKYNDWTVIIGLDVHGKMCHFDRFQLTWQLTKERIRELPADTLKVIDATGVGDVIYEELSEEVDNLEPFKFSGTSKPKIIYKLVKAVEKGEVKFNEITADEMSVFEVSYTTSGHYKFEAASGYHDDCVAALAMANAYKEEGVRASSWQVYSV